MSQTSEKKSQHGVKKTKNVNLGDKKYHLTLSNNLQIFS